MGNSQHSLSVIKSQRERGLLIIKTQRERGLFVMESQREKKSVLSVTKTLLIKELNIKKPHFSGPSKI